LQTKHYQSWEKLKKKNRFKLVYQGHDQEAADQASIDFWKECPSEKKFSAIVSLAEDYFKLKGKELPDGKKFLRSTAVIKRF
jgi:hypothetical protein